MVAQKNSFIVAFGDSNAYVVSPDVNHFVDSQRFLNDVQQRLRSYLRSHYPDASIPDYFTTPRIEDTPENISLNDYEPLNDKAFAEIEDYLDRTVRVRAQTARLNNNAPFDKI